MTCSGRGCGFRTLSEPTNGISALTHRLVHQTFTAGDKVTVIVSSGHAPVLESLITIRRAKVPLSHQLVG